MSSSRIPSPARSQGVRSTPRRSTQRRTRSVSSPAKSENSVKLTAIIPNSFVVSPIPKRRSVLTDDTDIEQPRRQSWWKKLNENSRDMAELLENKNMPESNNAIEENFDVEVLSQEKKNNTFDIPESSDGESINSIVMPQRKLFNMKMQKEKQPQKKFPLLVNKREELGKLQKSHVDHDKEINVRPRNLFNQNKKTKSKPIFPSALINTSIDKSIANKTKDIPVLEPKGQFRNLFGNRPGTKRKNMFADFVLSESEDEIPEIQPHVFAFRKKEERRRRTSNVSRGLAPSPTSSNIDLDLDEWKHLPSSTMVDNQLEEFTTTPTKRARLTNILVEEETTHTDVTNKAEKQNNESVTSRNRSKRFSHSKTKEMHNLSMQKTDKINNSSRNVKQQKKPDKSITGANSSKKDIQLPEHETITSVVCANSKHDNVITNHTFIEREKTETNKQNQTNEVVNLSHKSVLNDDESDAEDNFTLEYENDDENDKNSVELINPGNNESNDSGNKELSNVTNTNISPATISKQDQINSVDLEKLQKNGTLENVTKAPKSKSFNKTMKSGIIEEDNNDDSKTSFSVNDTIKNPKLQKSHESANNEGYNNQNASRNIENKFNDVKDKTNLGNTEKHMIHSSLHQNNQSQNQNTSDKVQEEQNQSNKQTFKEILHNKISADISDKSVHNTDRNAHHNVYDNNPSAYINDVIGDDSNKSNINDMKEPVYENAKNVSDKAYREHDDEIADEHLEISQKDDESTNTYNENSEHNNESFKHSNEDLQNDNEESLHDDEKSVEASDEDLQNNSNNESSHEGGQSLEANDEDLQNDSNNESSHEGGERLEANDVDLQNDSNNESSHEGGESLEANDVDLQNDSNNESSHEGGERLEANDGDLQNDSNNESSHEGGESLEANDGDLQNDSNNESSHEGGESLEANEDLQNDNSNESHDDEECIDDDGNDENSQNDYDNQIVDDESLHDIEDNLHNSRQSLDNMSKKTDNDDENLIIKLQNSQMENITKNNVAENLNKNDVQSQKRVEQVDQVDCIDDHITKSSKDCDNTENERIQGNSIEDASFATVNKISKKQINNETRVDSPEAVLQAQPKSLIESFALENRNTARKTKSMVRNTKLKPSLAPVRESTGLSDGTKNSSADSEWDSHRITRKTLRQTFGKDATSRMSLRALVMEKSAKRQTFNPDLIDISKHPHANSTELPGKDHLEDTDDTVETNYEQEEATIEESDHELSKRRRQTTLEMYLKKIKQQDIERETKIKENVKNSLKMSRDINHFKVPVIPMRRTLKPTQKKPKPNPAKTTPSSLNFLPPDVLEDMKYKPPKRFQPGNASWITKRLYKFLESKLEAKYNYMARVRAEKLAETIYEFTKTIRRYDVAPPDAVEVLKREMARLKVVTTHHEFYEFFHEYMPREIRVKVIPDIVNKISLPKHGVFTDIIR